MYDLNIHVFLTVEEHVKDLERQTAEAIARADEYKKKMQRYEMIATDEQRVNLELIDTLRANGLRYRQSADMRTWSWSR